MFNTYADSLQSNYSLDETSSQSSSITRPSGKAIYVRRKEYAESINKQLAKFQYRVEHLFTCELDGVEVSGLQDCVERLKLLEMMGRVWGQEMSLEVDNGNLLLRDIETQEELDCVSLLSVSEVNAELDTCVFNSLLMISVCEGPVISVFMFQCDSIRADYIKRDLDRVLQNNNIANNDRGRIRTQMMKNNTHTHSPPEQKEWIHPHSPPKEWIIPDYDQTPPQTPPSGRQEPVYNRPELLTPHSHVDDSAIHPSPPPAPSTPPYTQRDRNVDILNHLINDIEQFVDLILAAAPNIDKKKKKKKKNQKGLPSAEKFKICLQKIKMAFNLLAVINGQIQSPSAPELVHCLFSTLEVFDDELKDGFYQSDGVQHPGDVVREDFCSNSAGVVSRCADDLPACVVAPLLEPECVRFLSEEATQEEDQLWQSLGDAWNIPSTQWPEDDDEIPTFTPVFDDGWEPPEISHSERKAFSCQESQQSTVGQSKTAHMSSEDMPLSCIRVLYDFRARNDRELSVRKGEMVETLDMSKRWWKVRNDRGEEGFIPNNVLKSTENEDTQGAEPNPVLNRKSRPEEVKAWLEHKEFSNITVRCLGGLSGGMLLGMTLEELKVVCPEEGRRVYYQLQNVKSALALAKM